MISIWKVPIGRCLAIFLLYLAIMTGLLNVGARVQGKRMVYNTLSVDLNESALADSGEGGKEND